jgi:hypothetical protein
MAKTSQVNRNGKRERMAARDKGKRAALKAIMMDRTLPVEDRFNASWSRAPALHPDGARPWQLSQVQTVPHRAARPRQLGANSRHGQGELVGKGTDHVNVRSVG